MGRGGGSAWPRLLVPVIGISLDVAQHHNPAANRKFPGIRAGLVNMRVSSAAYP
jgi:hypothetical protein